MAPCPSATARAAAAAAVVAAGLAAAAAAAAAGGSGARRRRTQPARRRRRAGRWRRDGTSGARGRRRAAAAAAAARRARRAAAARRAGAAAEAEADEAASAAFGEDEGRALERVLLDLQERKERSKELGPTLWEVVAEPEFGAAALEASFSQKIWRTAPPRREGGEASARYPRRSTPSGRRRWRS